MKKVTMGVGVLAICVTGGIWVTSASAASVPASFPTEAQLESHGEAFVPALAVPPGMVSRKRPIADLLVTNGGPMYRYLSSYLSSKMEARFGDATNSWLRSLAAGAVRVDPSLAPSPVAAGAKGLVPASVVRAPVWEITFSGLTLKVGPPERAYHNATVFVDARSGRWLYEVLT